MAKIIETKDGIRLLVSDDTPEDIDYETAGEVSTSSNNQQEKLVDPVTVQIAINHENRVIPVQAERFSLLDTKRETATLSGMMTLEDFLWLAEHQDKTVTGLSTVSFQLLRGAYKVTRLTGKDMNALTVNVNVSFKKHT